MRDTVFIVRVVAERPQVDRHVSTCVTEHEPDVAGIRKYAERGGVVVDVNVEPVKLLGGNGISEIASWIDGVIEHDPKPVVARDPAHVMIDELRRAQMKQDRKLDQLTTLLGQMLEREERAARTVQPPVKFQRDALLDEASVRKAAALYGVDVEPIDEARVREQLELPEPMPARVLPMRAQHVEHGAADIKSALRENTTAGANGVVPGNMALRGGSVASEIMAVDIGPDGTPIVVAGSLPKVGDTLKPIGG